MTDPATSSCSALWVPLIDRWHISGIWPWKLPFDSQHADNFYGRLDDCIDLCFMVLITLQMRNLEHVPRALAKIRTVGGLSISNRAGGSQASFINRAITLCRGHDACAVTTQIRYHLCMRLNDVLPSCYSEAKFPAVMRSTHIRHHQILVFSQERGLDLYPHLRLQSFKLFPSRLQP